MDLTQVGLYILDNEDEKPRCARMPCEGVATLGELRALLERKPSPILWPFDFYDAEMQCRIATEFEQITLLEWYDHKVTVIRSDDRQAIEKTRKRVDEESMALLEPTTAKEVIPPASTVYIAPVACDPISAAPFEGLNEHEETSCPKLDPKHKVFLSHSGVEKSFVGKLCKLLEEHNHYPFFDQRPDSLPKGKKFAGLIIEATKMCQDKWMPKWIELARADPRVDLEKWAEAVRELRRANGIEFCRFEKKKELNGDAIVKAIFKLAPPNLLYDMSKIHGGDRICEILVDKFQ